MTGGAGMLEHLVLRAQRGDEWAQRRVVEIMGPVVGYLAKRFFPPGYEPQDVVGEAYIGLMKALHTFDLSRGASFRTFANTCIRAQLQTDLKRSLGARGYKKRLYLFAPHTDVQDLVSVEDHADAVTDDVVLQDDLAECREWLEENTTGLERDCALLAIESKKYSAIAAELSRKHGRLLDEKSVDNALCRVRRKALRMRAHRERLAARESETARDTARESETARDTARESETARDTARESETARDTARESETARDTARELTPVN